MRMDGVVRVDGVGVVKICKQGLNPINAINSKYKEREKAH
jgi:hypothetical protein